MIDEYGTPMSFNGKSGYFLEDEEYAKLVAAAAEDDRNEYLEELEIEVHNHRNTLDETRSTVYDLWKFLEDSR